MDRAYSLLHVKRVSEDQRVIEGVATTPEPDRVGDIVEPLGIKFRNPLPLLHQHDSDKPVGTVTFDRATKDGITFRASLPKIAEPGPLKDRVDTAWGEVKAGLVRAVSIGFRALDNGIELMRTGGVRYTKTEVLELSLVTVPANAGATITAIRSVAREQAASGRIGSSVQIILPPGVSGSSKPPDRREITMTTVSERIATLEQLRGQKVARIDEVMQKALAANRTTEEAERAECLTLKNEIEVIDGDLDLFRFQEKSIAATAQPVEKTASVGQLRSAIARSPITAPPRPKEKTEPGIAFTRLAKVRAVSRLEILPQLEVAEKMYGHDSETYQILAKAGEVLPGTAASGNWGVDLISPEGAAVADFVEWLRAGMITGKFGVNGVPAMNRIGFYEPYVVQTAAGVGYWVGEAKPIPLTSFDFDRSTLTPLKLGNIAMLSERNIRYSSPSSDMIIRDQLGRVLIETEDTAFIDPANNGSSNIKPASVTNAADSIASTGDDADDVRLDMRALLKKFTDANNPPRSGVFVMSTDNAIALGSMVNALGQPEFTGIGMDGGRLIGMPVIVSDHAGDIVALINASDIYYSDEGGVQVDVSREASIEMKDQANIQQDGSAATGAAMVSTFQNMLVAIRAVKTVNWKLRRSTAVAYLTSASWGGAVPAS